MYAISNRRYTGSKLKLADWIIETVREHCVGGSFLDMFAGTSVVSANMLPYVSRLILNDNLYANNIIYKAFYGLETFSQENLEKYKFRFQSLVPTDLTHGYFTRNYGDRYFSILDCRKIETIRNEIEAVRKELTDREYAILLASLIYSMDRCANTVGHFDAYIKKGKVKDRFIFDLIVPLDTANKAIEIHQLDANVLASSVGADIIYIDPPYNSRQYCQFYHIYETLVRWDEPELFGAALKPKGELLSEYCRSKAPDIFADLISKLRCSYIVVSYNNTYDSKSSSSRNKITLEQINKILSSRGMVKTFSKSHQYFNAGKTNFSDHKELLFVVEVTK